MIGLSHAGQLSWKQSRLADATFITCGMALHCEKGAMTPRAEDLSVICQLFIGREWGL